MIEHARLSVAQRVADEAANEQAVRQAVREAALASARAGIPVPTERDGKVVWLQPAEVFALFAEPPADGTAANP
jgi:hypothetical protein